MSFFISKGALTDENTQLAADLAEARARVHDRDMLMAENTSLKALMGRTDASSFLLAAVLTKPGQSPYDILTIDVGTDEGIHVGDSVFSDGTVLIGRISDVYAAESRVKLFSTAGEENTVRFTGSDVDLILHGAGGGSYEIEAPKGFPTHVGDTVSMAGITPALVAEVSHITDDGSSLEKIYLRMPSSLFGLNWVEIKRYASVSIQK